MVDIRTDITETRVYRLGLLLAAGFVVYMLYTGWNRTESMHGFNIKRTNLYSGLAGHQVAQVNEQMKALDTKDGTARPVTRVNSPNAIAKNVVPSVGNILNRRKGWNDTPTVGMLNGVKGTKAPADIEGNSSATPVPGGLPVTDSNYCAVPTGFLGRIVKAWERGDRNGIVNVDGVLTDMGHPGGNQFYDTTGNGCCDTFCRRVVKGGYWSCVTPQTVTTQYTAMNPTGSPCSHYGRNSTSKLSPMY